MDREKLITRELINGFKNSKMNGYVSHTEPLLVNGQTTVLVMSEAFQAGFDFGLDAAEQFLIPGKESLYDHETIMQMVEKVLTETQGYGILNMRNLEDRRSGIERLTLRLLDIPNLYGEYLQRDEVIDMAIRDAVSFKQKLREVVI